MTDSDLTGSHEHALKAKDILHDMESLTVPEDVETDLRTALFHFKRVVGSLKARAWDEWLWERKP